MEMLFNVALTVDDHAGQPEGRKAVGHKNCDTCRREKAIMVLMGGEEMSNLFKQVGVMVDGWEEVFHENSYVRAMDKVEQGIEWITKRE